VVRRLILTLLTLLLLLAAGVMTALFIFRHSTPVEFQQATASQPVSFTRDEAAHFDAQTEWWYYTGFLTGEDGQSYGFEVVFFKAYMPPQVRIGNVLPLNLLSNPIYFAHFAVSDEAVQEHAFFEQASFPAFWDAGARDDRYRVWNGDWRAWGGDGEHHLRAAAGRYALRLDLDSAKPPILQGPQGVEDMGQAGTSYYYSYTDLSGVGLLYVDGVRHVVQATAWMDHQWGSWKVHGALAGWDWFSLRLDDDSQVMLLSFRDDEGNVQPESGGTWIAADGSSHLLSLDDYTLETLEVWTSPDTGAIYPIKWHVTIPDYGLDIVVEATFPEQELATHLGPIYWEGSVTVDGTVDGVGYVELIGYVPGSE